MFLRWMVRNDNCGVDFGIWKQIQPQQLICPLDVHVANVALQLNILENNKSNWGNALKLTNTLKKINSNDPTLLDYALFGLGIEGKFSQVKDS